MIFYVLVPSHRPRVQEEMGDCGSEQKGSLRCALNYKNRNHNYCNRPSVRLCNQSHTLSSLIHVTDIQRSKQPLRQWKVRILSTNVSSSVVLTDLRERFHRVLDTRGRGGITNVERHRGAGRHSQNVAPTVLQGRPTIGERGGHFISCFSHIIRTFC